MLLDRLQNKQVLHNDDQNNWVCARIMDYSETYDGRENARNRQKGIEKEILHDVRKEKDVGRSHRYREISFITGRVIDQIKRYLF